jgi:Tol biopolymer transport system component
VNLDTDGEQGMIARTGDPGGAAEAAFSHDGTRIVYVSGNSFADGRFSYGPGDLYAVPYANRTGGTAQKLNGASDPSYTEYYPAFSPDDAYVAFTRFQGTGDSYSNPQAEVLIVPAGGGSATRFGANDPPACQSGAQSPGVTNDWAKWSPEATTAANGKTYYWVVFSSKRSGHAQLYLAAMTVASGALDASYPALYLWNQPSTDDNHTPSWDDYQIPSISIGYVGRR